MIGIDDVVFFCQVPGSGLEAFSRRQRGQGRHRRQVSLVISEAHTRHTRGCGEWQTIDLAFARDIGAVRSRFQIKCNYVEQPARVGADRRARLVTKLYET